MSKKLQMLLLASTLFAAGCKKDLKTEVKPATSSFKTVTVGPYQSAKPYNVNVVYFLASDVTARPEYERRVSEIMLATQEYYRQNMYNWGFGSKSFGLLVNPLTNLVKISVVHGSQPISAYTYSAGSTPILADVNAYFAAHPEEKTSEHTIIFTATPSVNTEIPYYGLGHSCFVGDNDMFDYQYFNQSNARGAQVKASMGGLLHELGHALGLPHDALGKTLQNVPGYGTSLMSWGNQTYGYSSTILTKASCAILNNCQVFATETKPAGYFYAGNKDFTITSIYHNVVNGQIRVWGNYTVNSPINAINSYFIPNTAYYHAVSGSAYSANTFFFAIDTSDLYFTDRDYEFVLQAQFLDGSSVYKSFPFKFVDGEPVLSFMTELNRSSWTASSSSQYPAYPASLAIDGNVNTYWHSNYQAGSVQTAPYAGLPQAFPYNFDIDLGGVKGLWGLSFTQNQALTRTAKNLYVYTRATTNDGWTLQGSYDLKNVTYKQYVRFPRQANCRYIRIVYYSSYDGQPYVAMPEIGAI